LSAGFLACAASAIADARLAALALALAGCVRPSPPSASARRVHDGLGREVALPAVVRRVVSLAPSSTEILFAVGAGPLLVGVDRYSDWPPEARAVQKVGADVDPSLERILALKPDVVFTATSANTQATAEALARLGLAVFVSRAGSLEEIYADVVAVGGAAGRAAEAARLSAAMRARIEAVHARAARRPPVPTLVVVWPEPLVVAGRASHVGDLLAAAGARNVADDSAQPFPAYSLERVIARAPELIVVGTHDHGTPPLAPLERLSTVPAVRQRRIHVVDGNLLFRPGPRVTDGVELLAHLVAP
jgi:iron complex transport system substrate-binding protein